MKKGEGDTVYGRQHFNLGVVVQGSYGSWKTWKVVEFYLIFNSFSMLGKSWKFHLGHGK